MHPYLRLTPLGGLGEIGMNCLLVAYGKQRIVIDCGVTFDDRGLGLDVIHADLGALSDPDTDFLGLVLTHGHEDHIGAVSFLLQEHDVPVYGPPYALALVRERLNDRERDKPLAEPRLVPIEPGSRTRIGPFDVEPYRVAHSMPDCTGLILRTPVGVVVHSGDFKIDPSAPSDERLDLDRLERLREEEGVRLLLSDSTNSLAEGESGHESMVAERFLAHTQRAAGRVVVSMFASNVHRIRAAVSAARRSDRKLCLLGRSLDTHARVASSLGYLDDLSSLRLSKEQARVAEPGSLMILATGTQGEPAAALSKLAAGNHPTLQLSAGDRVIHSARVIPGHEQSVFDLFNALVRRGVSLVSRMDDPHVHVSGHAYRGEQRRLIDALKPECFMPIHGTYLHLLEHARLAQRCGVGQVEVIENGASVELDQHGIRLGPTLRSGRVHRERGQAVDDLVIRDRSLLAELGIAVVTVQVDDEGYPVGDIDVLTRGVLVEDLSQSVLDDACEAVSDSLEASVRRHGPQDLDDVEQTAKRALKRFFARTRPKRPLCYAIALQATRR